MKICNSERKDLILLLGVSALILLLGLGPDAHVASLFPGFPQLDSDEIAVVEITTSTVISKAIGR